MRPLEAALDYLDRIFSLDDEALIRDELLRRARMHGLDRMAVVELPQASEPLRIHLCNWPVELFELYRSSLHRNDPIARHAGRTTEPFVWSEVSWDRSRASPEQQVMSLAAEFGLEDGLVVPILSLDGNLGAISLSGSRMRLEESDRRALHLMCVFTHHAISRQRARDKAPAPRRALSAAQRDCLAFALEGQDARAISDRTPLSDREAIEAGSLAARAFRMASPLNAAIVAVLSQELAP